MRIVFYCLIAVMAFVPTVTLAQSIAKIEVEFRTISTTTGPDNYRNTFECLIREVFVFRGERVFNERPYVKCGDQPASNSDAQGLIYQLNGQTDFTANCKTNSAGATTCDNGWRSTGGLGKGASVSKYRLASELSKRKFKAAYDSVTSGWYTYNGKRKNYSDQRISRNMEISLTSKGCKLSKYVDKLNLAEIDGYRTKDSYKPISCKLTRN